MDLPFDVPADLTSAHQALDVYSAWLGVAAAPGSPVRPGTPACLRPERQHFTRILLNHISLLFRARPDALRAEHIEICHRALNVLEAAARSRRWSRRTWHHALRLLLAVVDHTLGDSPAACPAPVGDALAQHATRTLLVVWMQSGTHDARLWGLLTSAFRRWTRRPVTLGQWSAAALALTRRVLAVLWSGHGKDTLSIDWVGAPADVISGVSQARAVFLWHRILALPGDFSAIPAPPSLELAVSGLSAIAHALTGVGRRPLTATAPTPRPLPTPPDTSAVLHIIGAPLYQAALCTEPEFQHGRASAIRVLADTLAASPCRRRLADAHSGRVLLVVGRALASRRDPLAVREALAAACLLLRTGAAGARVLLPLIAPHLVCIVEGDDAPPQTRGRFRKASVAPAIETYSRPPAEPTAAVSEGIPGAESGVHAFIAAVGQPPQRSCVLDGADAATMFAMRRLAARTMLALVPLTNHFQPWRRRRSTLGTDAGTQPQWLSGTAAPDAAAVDAALTAERDVDPSPPTPPSAPHSPLSVFTDLRRWLGHLLVDALRNETDADTLHLLLWAVAAKTREDAATSPGLAQVAVSAVCHGLLRSRRPWPARVRVVALSALASLATVQGAVRDAAPGTPPLLVRKLSEVIEVSARAARAPDAPPDADTVAAAACRCMLAWVHAAPWILASSVSLPPLAAAIAEAVDLGGTRQPGRPDADTELRLAAEALLNHVLLRAAHNPTPGGGALRLSDATTETDLAESLSRRAPAEAPVSPDEARAAMACFALGGAAAVLTVVDCPHGIDLEPLRTHAPAGSAPTDTPLLRRDAPCVVALLRSPAGKVCLLLETADGLADAVAAQRAVSAHLRSAADAATAAGDARAEAWAAAARQQDELSRRLEGGEPPFGPRPGGDTAARAAGEGAALTGTGTGAGAGGPGTEASPAAGACTSAEGPLARLLSTHRAALVSFAGPESAGDLAAVAAGQRTHGNGGASAEDAPLADAAHRARAAVAVEARRRLFSAVLAEQARREAACEDPLAVGPVPAGVPPRRDTATVPLHASRTALAALGLLSPTDARAVRPAPIPRGPSAGQFWAALEGMDGERERERMWATLACLRAVRGPAGEDAVTLDGASAGFAAFVAGLGHPVPGGGDGPVCRVVHATVDAEVHWTLLGRHGGSLAPLCEPPTAAAPAPAPAPAPTNSEPATQGAPTDDAAAPAAGEGEEETADRPPSTPTLAGIGSVLRLVARSTARAGKVMVLVLWNEAERDYTPGTELWRELGLPPAGVILVVTPLEDGLFSVRIHDTKAAPKHLPGPLVDGMVLSRSVLAPLVSETIANTYRERQPRHPAARPYGRRQMLLKSFANKYAAQASMATLYTSLFVGNTARA